MVTRSPLGRWAGGAAALYLAWQAPARADDASGFSVDVSDEYSYDDNLYRLPAQLDVAPSGISRVDHINTTSMGGTGRLHYAHQQVSLDLHVDDNRFGRNASLNNTSGLGRITWDWLVSPHFSGTAGTDFTRTLAGFADNRFFAKDLVDTSEYFASAVSRFTSRWSINGELREADTTHSAGPRQIDDFHSRSGTVGVRYYLAEQSSVGVDYRYIDAYFPQPATFQGAPFQRDYRDSDTRLLVKYAVTGKASFDASVGYLTRHYLHSSFGSFSGNVWRASLQQQLTGKTQVQLSGWRELTAYLDAQSDYFVSQGGSIAPTWSLSGKISLTATASWTRQDYLSSSPSAVLLASRLDHVRSGQAALNYTPRDWLTVVVSYRYERRDSNRPQFPYDDRLASANMTIKY
jgi:hypothetical protein